MQTHIHLHGSGRIPLSHGYQLGSVLYDRLTGDARRLIGFGANPRLLSLSSIYGKGTRANRSDYTLHVDGACQFSLTSPLGISAIKEALGKEIVVDGLRLKVVDFDTCLAPSGPVEYWAASHLSPVLTRASNGDFAGRWITPEQSAEECESALRRNLIGRWKALSLVPELSSALEDWTGVGAPGEDWGKDNLPRFEFIEARAHKRSFKRGAVLVGWSGVFRMIGHAAWTQVIWNTGLGPKSIFGFGTVKPCSVTPSSTLA